jgi:glycosyltransferase involved in cell wall biosynthesis
MDFSVVIPVYNEEECITPLYASLCGALNGGGKSFEVILVNDGSRDSTPARLDALAEQDPRVRVVHLRRNFGQTAAMMAGIEHATGDYVVTMDADLQNDPTDIPLLLKQLDSGYDLAHGWRRHRQDAFLSRKLPSSIANWLISRVTNFPVRDLGCTLKAMRREVAEDLNLYGEMHRFIPIVAHARGARCVEVETAHHPRRFGKTKYGISRTFRVILDLVTIKYLIQFYNSPMRLFGAMGLATAGFGTLAGMVALMMKLSSGYDVTGNPLLYVSLFSLMLGLQFFSLGMLGEMCMRIYYESQGRKPYAIRRVVNPAAAHPLESRRQAA